MGFENKGNVTKNYKLVREIGGARVVHAKGCPTASKYDIMGLEEIEEFKPEKMRACAKCEKQVYIANAAVDYQKQYRNYWAVFQNVSIVLIRRLFHSHHLVKMEFIGNRLYIRADRERWYIDLTLFGIGEVHLFHNNYNVKKRNEGDAAWNKPGYHEHELKSDLESFDQMSEAIRRIAVYDYEEAKRAHKRKRVQRQKVTHTLSEVDAAYWGYDEDEPMLMKM